LHLRSIFEDRLPRCCGGARHCALRCPARGQREVLDRDRCLSGVRLRKT